MVIVWVVLRSLFRGVFLACSVSGGRKSGARASGRGKKKRRRRENVEGGGERRDARGKTQKRRPPVPLLCVRLCGSPSHLQHLGVDVEARVPELGDLFREQLDAVDAVAKDDRLVDAARFAFCFVVLLFCVLRFVLCVLRFVVLRFVVLRFVFLFCAGFAEKDRRGSRF